MTGGRQGGLAFRLFGWRGHLAAAATRWQTVPDPKPSERLNNDFGRDPGYDSGKDLRNNEGKDPGNISGGDPGDSGETRA